MAAAMMLAAGLGTRLRPLTSFVPKPLVPLGLRPLLDWHLEALGAAGVDLVALNASHLGERIESHLRRGAGSPRVELLREEVPLGTGGGLLGAIDMLANQEDFLVINADVFHSVDLAGAIAAHRSAGAAATLVVRRVGPSEPRDEVVFDGRGRLVEIGGSGAGPRWRFTGIHVLSPAVFQHLSSPGSLADGYRGLLGAGATIIGCDCGDSRWFDVGTPASYLEANRACVREWAEPGKATGYATVGASLVAESAELGPGCSVGPDVVVGEEALIGRDSHLSDCVVWPRTSVPPGTTVERCVVHPGGILAVSEPGASG